MSKEYTTSTTGTPATLNTPTVKNFSSNPPRDGALASPHRRTKHTKAGAQSSTVLSEKLNPDYKNTVLDGEFSHGSLAGSEAQPSNPTLTFTATRTLTSTCTDTPTCTTTGTMSPERANGVSDGATNTRTNTDTPANTLTETSTQTFSEPDPLGLFNILKKSVQVNTYFSDENVNDFSISSDFTVEFEHKFPSPDLLASAAGMFSDKAFIRDDDEQYAEAMIKVYKGLSWHYRKTNELTHVDDLCVFMAEEVKNRLVDEPRSKLFTYVVTQLMTMLRTVDDNTFINYQVSAASGVFELKATARKVLGDKPSTPTDRPQRMITCWSKPSQRNMVKQLAAVDWSPIVNACRIPCMVTLTYPGKWESAAPDGKVVKCHLKTFFKRYERKYGKLRCCWKMEFQSRGAPHFHLYLLPPANLNEFKQWLSFTWADIVNHPDPAQRAVHERAGTGVHFIDALRCTDPKRLAIYFAKHGDASGKNKEYQHIVPDLWVQSGVSVGRFWGIYGLDRIWATIPVSYKEFIALRRIMRKIRGRIVIHCHSGETFVKKRKRYKPPPDMSCYAALQWQKMCRQNIIAGGYITVNDGASFLATLSKN